MKQEPTVGDFFQSLWRARYALIVGALVGVLVAALLLTLAVPRYKAALLLGGPERLTNSTRSVSQETAAELKTILQNFVPAGLSDFVRFEHTLRGASVAKILYEDPRIRAGVLADESFRGVPSATINSAAALAAYLERKVRIEPVGQTALRRVVYYHPDPEFAAFFLEKLYKTADDLIRAETLRKSENRLLWLQEALDHATHPQHKKALTALLINQEQIRMLAAIDGESFATTVIEPVAVTAKPYWPRKALFFAVSLFAGLFLAYGIWAARRQDKA